MAVDSQKLFDTESLNKNLKTKSVKAGAITITAHFGKFILRMGSTIVLARLLTPQDYGLIGMVTVVTNFILLFRDLGLSTATIQKAEINREQVSTLFWLNVALGAIVSLLIAGLAPIISRFYQEPRLTGITIVLALSFLIASLGTQHQALLKRQMYFGKLANISIVSMLVSVLVAICMAKLGAGYWSLVGMQLAETTTSTVGMWIFCRWIPGLPGKYSEVSSMVNYGSNLTGFRCVNYFSRNLDNILIGRFWGSQQLGLYAKAYQLLLLPISQINSPINSIALPALSRLQSEPDRYRRFYCKAILAITFLGMPLVMFMFATADKMVLLLLGEQWLGIIPLFRFLMPAAFIGTFNVAVGWVFQSLGRTDRQFRLGIVVSTINVIIFSVSVKWGVIAVAAAYGISQPILMIFAVIYCFQGTPLKLTDLADALSKPMFASIGSALIVIGIEQFGLIKLNLSLNLLLDGFIYLLSYIGIWLLLPNGKSTLVELFSLFKELKKKK